MKPVRLLVTVKLPSIRADTLIQYAVPSCGDAGGVCAPGCGGVIGATGMAAWFAVGNEYSRHGVLLAAEEREMNLPEILEAGRAEKNPHCVRLSTFARAIVRDDDSRPKGVHEDFGIRTGLPMT